jgi:hypothetical protein
MDCGHENWNHHFGLFEATMFVVMRQDIPSPA